MCNTPTTTRSASALQSAPAVNSAAADWSRWPRATRFSAIRANGRAFRMLDDYGWARREGRIPSTFTSPRARDNAWGEGVKHVTIENLQWGDRTTSLAILRSAPD